MPVKVEISVCDRGSISVYHEGDTRLLAAHAGDVQKIIDEISDNAKLDVVPRKMNVLESYLTKIVDPVVERVARKLRSRSRRGIRKYQKMLDRDDLTEDQWLTHLQEELLDAANYCESVLLNRERKRDT